MRISYKNEPLSVNDRKILEKIKKVWNNKKRV